MGFQKGFKRSPENILKQRETRRLNSEKRKKEKLLVENSQPNIIPSNNPIQKNIVKSINLKGEFETMSEQVNPKSKPSDEPKYECGQCHTKFNDKMKYCPGCGVEFA